MIKEEKLIKRVQAGDDEALEKLFHLYEPLVNSIVNQFYLHHYDRKDWDQEAMIMCYEAALVFSPEKGKFSSLYKTKLTNHARTLVRYNMARRRQVYSQSIPWNQANIQGVNEPRRSELAIPVDEIYNNFVNSLSHVELIALLTIIGEISTEYAIDHMNIEAMKLVRARSRTLQKMRNILF
ncbi:sigma-70 family RNA polymerase sigma factor [uncultured Lactobacillus sp.]|uniref:sigma-70 family RNA polymerase sigma factor n=1 Tax=uncultured Lactobacillus sp. TaxID=153152 RepID=UPI002615057F|nr:sigma-70 family RNA polymerase sigma factor [uncultured Lactobacillus sp.]